MLSKKVNSKMRLKLTLEQQTKGQSIPINYQHGISAYFYKTLNSIDEFLADKLHSQGFKNNNKNFKFFNFSRLEIPEFEIFGDRLFIGSKHLYLNISIMMNDIYEKFLAGLFAQYPMKLVDGKSEANFKIKYVEAEPEPEFTGEAIFSTKSPIVIKDRVENMNTEVYLSPLSNDYFPLFKKNLEEKYLAYCVHTNTQAKELNLESMEVLNEPKSKLISISVKGDKPVKIRAYNFTFRLKGSPEILKFGYNSGFGINNSMGFGYVNKISENGKKFDRLTRNKIKERSSNHENQNSTQQEVQN